MKTFAAGKLICIVAFGVILSGCKYSDSYLVRHPDTFKSVLETCQSMGEAAKNDQQCVSAMFLYHQTYSLSQQLVQNPALFGREVLDDQMKLGEMKVRIDKLMGKNKEEMLSSEQADLVNIKAKYNALKQLVDIKIGIIGQMEGV